MNNRGFTLVEIIAVIAIMALIIVVAAPNIFKFGDNANSSALKTKLDNIETAVELYVEKNSNDIVYRCVHNEGCICTIGFINNGSSSYTCRTFVSTFLNFGVYSETNKNSNCKIVNPKNSGECLENREITVRILTNTNSAIAEISE